LFGFYRASEANDPETFIAGATAMLAQYPEHVAGKVCDPIRGLPAKSKFLPAIAEIREACELEMVWYHAVERRELERQRTAEILKPAPPAAPGARERVRAMADQVIGDLGGLAPAADKPLPGRARPLTIRSPEFEAYLAHVREELAEGAKP
jgi:hypothetical protein